MIVTIFKALRKLKGMCFEWIYTPFAKIVLSLNGVKYGSGLKVLGALKVIVTRRGVVKIGKNCSINSGNNFNIIGRQQRMTFWVEGNLTIGDNVGMSCSSIICNHSITIGNYVTMGGNVVIYDSDFHSLDPAIRSSKEDKKNTLKRPVIIKDRVFIGAHSTILKGVTIGENAVIGACSVVTRDVPDNEIWAGNPARFIKRIEVLQNAD